MEKVAQIFTEINGLIEIYLTKKFRLPLKGKHLLNHNGKLFQQ